MILKMVETISTITRKEKAYFENYARQERKGLDEKITWSKFLEEGIKQMTRERQIGFPWLAKAFDELFRLE